MPSGVRPSVRPGSSPGSSHRERGPGALVLVVDDYAHTREMYAEFLSFVGFRVASAETGALALRAARRRRPSLVVMDLALPDMTGWQAASFLRREAITKDVPIIAVTAYPETHAREVAMRAGCDLFLEKPVTPNDLVEAIRRLLARREAQRR